MATIDTGALVGELRQRAKALGFDSFGIAPADARPDLRDKLESSLAAGWHAGMAWMETTAERRCSPAALWSDVRSVIMVGMNYAPDDDPLALLADRERGVVSVYARHRDYHELIKGRLKEIAGLLARRSGAEVKVFVDTAPVMEKPLAEAAGIGWQGKHSVLVSREFGSWLFLGAIFTSASLPADGPHPENCGSCTACIDICPTDAFPAPFRLDARKCLAYYSVEHEGPIPHEFRTPMGNRIFGCDDCLVVCPWNKFASAAREIKLSARDELRAPLLAELVALDEAGFRAFSAATPVRRLGYARFLRNVLIAVGNSGSHDLLPLAEARLGDPDPLIRGTAVWAVRSLAPTDRIRALRLAFQTAETDMSVISEWEAELAPPLDHKAG